MRRAIAFGGLLSVVMLAGCTTDESRRSWFSRDVFSERAPARLAKCVSAEWHKFSELVNVAPYELGKAVRIIHPDLGVIFQAIIVPGEGGSVMTLGSPFKAQFPNYAPMAEKCAGKR
jgi:hypothetical protein